MSPIPVRIDTHAWYPRAALTPVKEARLREHLTIVRKSYGQGESERVELFRETLRDLGIPRAYFQKHIRPEHHIVDATSEGEPWGSDATFQGVLHDPQVRAHDAVVDHLSTNYGALLEAAPGFGKTVVTCAILATLRRRTLVLVHKEFLADQWAKRIQAFLPGVRVGRIQGAVCDTEADVVLALVQTLVSREWPESFWRQFGVMVGDEVHRVAADTWTPAACMIPSRYRLGLSATFRRKDGCERVFFDHIGPVVFSHRTPRLLPKIQRVQARRDKRPLGEPRDRVAAVTRIAKDKARTAHLADLAVRAAQHGRKVLMFSERRPHLEAIAALIPPSITTGYYVGGRSEKQLAEAEQAQVVLATRQLVEEGLDIPALDTLILATPLVDPEQTVGRILRPSEGKRPPLVLDVRDTEALFVAFARKRDQWYAELGWDGAAALAKTA